MKICPQLENINIKFNPQSTTLVINSYDNNSNSCQKQNYKLLIQTNGNKSMVFSYIAVKNFHVVLHV